ncbi:hypothetical protein AB0F83_27540, partial [Micromonospora chalcea]
MRDAVRVWVLAAGAPPDVLARYRAVLDPAERARAARLDCPGGEPLLSEVTETGTTGVRVHIGAP